MNLPIFNPLLTDSSTYITFSKGILDFDYAVTNNKPYYFSKMVAMNLPIYENPSFYIDLSSINIVEKSPNTVIPKGLSNYMENIINNYSEKLPHYDNITELAFYKFLNKCGLSYNTIFNSITYINKIMTSNFVKTENNNGWGEIVCVVPNNARKTIINKKRLDNFPSIIVTNTPNNSDDALYDNGDKQYLFSDESKNVIDFSNITYDNSTTNDSFDFNIILVYYTDHTGIDKLHGINFINPFVNKITHFELPVYSKKYNDSRSIGYQFKLNIKTVNNEASRILVEEYNDGFWTTHFDTLSRLNTFLDKQNIKFREI